MFDALATPITGSLFFNYTNAVTGRPLGRGFGLIDDDIHALIEHARQANTSSDADGAVRHVTTCG
jgi:hypothetical protein